MVDYYPDEEGVLLDGISIGWAQASTTIYANTPIKLATATAGNIVIAAAGDRAGIGVAMKAGSSSDYIPVLFYGVVKMFLSGTCVVGAAVVSGAAAATCGYVTRIPSYTVDQQLLLRGLNYTGTVEVLGKAIQGGTTGDEILILVAPL